MNVTQVNDLILEETLVSAKPGDWILVAFVLSGLPPTNHFRPELAGLAPMLSGQVKVLELDVAEHPGTREVYRLKGYPVSVLYQDYDEKARWEGPYSRETLFEKIQKVIEPKAKGGTE